MKKLAIILIIFIIVTFLSCNNEITPSTQIVNGNGSGDVWDTTSITTVYPVSLVTSVVLEIGNNSDTTTVYSEKLLKLKIGGGYNIYCAYTKNLLIKMLLSEKVSQGYCLDITVLSRKRGFDNKDAVVISYAVKKIVNHMGG